MERKGKTGKCLGKNSVEANCQSDSCVKARQKTGKPPSRVQFVLIVTNAYFNNICKNSKTKKVLNNPTTKNS
jgi:hypothetical protein